jgi:hypothetical protein
VARSIGDLLQRRGDLSTFLVHLTSDYNGKTARAILKSILKSRTLEARSVFGMGKKLAGLDEETRLTQLTVCFTETPLEHVWMMCEEIESRDKQLAPYGLAITKSWARSRGVNPVWYLDITAGHTWLTGPIQELLDLAYRGEALRLSQPCPQQVAAKDSQVARLAPFIEQMGKPVMTRKEFWWEREWRHVGNLRIPWPQLVAVFVPESDQEAFQAELNEELGEKTTEQFPDTLRMLDPCWGLERMIACFAGVSPEHVGPFPR